MKKSVLIVGSNGQDGRILTNILSKNYDLFGFIKKKSSFKNSDNIKVFINDGKSCTKIKKFLKAKRIIKIFYFAGESFVSPDKILDNNYINYHIQILNNFMKAIVDTNKKIKFIYANSSEVFGNPIEIPQSENTPHNPANIYGFTRSLMYQILKYYRSNLGLNLINIFFYNHESSYRNKKFFTKKILDYAKSNHKKKLEIGSLKHKRDIGSANQYMQITYKLSKKVNKGDYIISTGKQTSYNEIVNQIFKKYKLNKKKLIKYNKKFNRNFHSSKLVGDNSKIKKLLNIDSFVSISEEIDGLLSDNDLT